MNRHEKFGRKVLSILEDNCDWGEEVVLEIADLAIDMGLATDSDGEFEADHFIYQPLAGYSEIGRSILGVIKRWRSLTD